MRVYIVDDSRTAAAVAQGLLESAGHDVTVCNSSVQALGEIPEQRPELAILDIMMPELDGLELCRRLRATPGLEDLKIIVCSGKTYDTDRRRAIEMGADSYLNKPVEKASLLELVDRLGEDRMELRYWGVRGTLPRSGEGSLRYGGDTSCVSLRFPSGKLFVLDAGSGIKRLADSLTSQGERVEATILITHPHWDHLNAIPFFSPLYTTGNSFEIIGARHGAVGMKELVSAQMDGLYFPITIREFGADVVFREIAEGDHEIAGVEVGAMLLSHPGNCLGYRFRHHGRTLCYVTDNELYLRSSSSYSAEYDDQLVAFVQDADILITDTTYTDDEYQSRVNWGHSCVSRVIEIADRAQVKQLHLFHHDPDQDDDAIDAKLATARSLLEERGSKTRCVAPKQGDMHRV